MGQYVINGIVAGSVYALVALGFSIIYNTVHFFHFAHGAVYTIGAYLTYYFYVIHKWPFAIAVSLAIAGCALLGISIEFLVYKPIKNRNSNNLVLLIASLGVFIVLQNLVSLIFGDDTKTLRGGIVIEGIKLLGVRITPIQLSIIAASIILFLLFSVLLKYSSVGKAIRAVSCDPELALIIGLDTQKLLYYTYLTGSSLARIIHVEKKGFMRVTP